MWKKFKSLFKASRFSFMLQQALGSGQPGQWASDHRTESEQYTGWTYVAIRAICLQAMQATVSVYDDSGDPRRKSLRKAIRNDPFARRFKSLYAENEGESEPLPNDHPLCQLLKRPNPTQSGATFRYERVMQLQLTGTCIVWNVPNKFGKTVQRYVIPTAMASPVQPTADLPNGGYRIQSVSNRYSFVDEDGFSNTGMFNQVVGKIVPLEQLQVTSWPHPILKDDGQSPVSAGAKWIDSANQIDDARWSQMNNGADPSAIVGVPAECNLSKDELEALNAQASEKYGGTKNAGKMIFTNANVVTTLTTSPKDMSYGEGFEQLRDSILGLHGTPGVAAGITDGGSYAAFYASLKQFISLTVQPILDFLAEDDTEFLAPQFGGGLTIDIEAAQIDDPDILEKRLTTDIAAQCLKKNELRALRGLPPVSAAEGGDDWAGQQTPMPFGTPVAGAIPSSPASGSNESTTGVEGPPRLDSPDSESRLPNAVPVEEVTPKTNVQGTALNGAQVTSLVELATSLSKQQLPYESVKALILAAFPVMDVKLIDSILEPLQTFTPPTDEPIGKSHRFPYNNGATDKAREIVSKMWTDYPGGRP